MKYMVSRRWGNPIRIRSDLSEFRKEHVNFEADRIWNVVYNRKGLDWISTIKVN